MYAEAAILHADVDSFYASVHQRDDPRLRGRPVVVGAGIVMAATYEARAFGVRSAMPAERARRLCPDLVIVDPHWDGYVAASRDLFAVFREASPVVEGLSMEEAFLDARGLEHISGRPVQIAIRLRRDVRERVGLPLTVGIARTKACAKMASRTAKPDGLLGVAPGCELAFMHPIAIERIWGVGKSTARKLQARGIHTLGHAARCSEEDLIAILGPGGGRHLHALAHGGDRRPVSRGRARRSVGSQRGMGLARLQPEELDATVVALVDRVTRRLRKSRNVGRTVVLRMRFGDYMKASRSLTLAHPTAATEPILAAVRRLVADARPTIERRGLTMVGVTVQQLDDGRAVQLELPLDRSRGDDLDAALDAVRERFGAGAVKRGMPEMWR